MPTIEVAADYTHLVFGESETYATARGTATDQFEELGEVATSNDNNGEGLFGVLRSLFRFDTDGVVPDGNTVTGIVMRLTATEVAADDGAFDLEIVEVDWSAQDPVDAGNMDAVFDAVLAADTAAVWQNTANVTPETPQESGALNVDWLVLDGKTYYAMRTSMDKVGTEPTGFNIVGVGAYQHLTEAWRPTLVIEYAEAASGGALGGLSGLSGLSGIV